MTAFRLISLPFHGALELLLGVSTMAAPFVLGFGAAGTVVGLVVGALVVGLALGAGLILSIAGDAVAGVFFAAASAAQIALNLTTRYSVRA